MKIFLKSKKFFCIASLLFIALAILYVARDVPTGNDGCSSWIILRSTASLHQLILHKNRDKGSSADQIVTRVTGGTYDILGTRSTSDNYCNAGINSQGLAVAYNYAIGGSGIGWSTTQFVENILKNNRYLEDAYAYIKTNYGKVSAAGIILLAGPRKTPQNGVTFGGAVVEYIPSVIPGYKYSISGETNSYLYSTSLNKGVTNHYCVVAYPPASDDSTGTLHRKQVIEQNLIVNESNAVANLEMSFELSRNVYLCKYPDDPYYPDSDDVTLNGVTFVIDFNNPTQKSCMWIALGAPDASIYTPFHLTALAKSGGSFVNPLNTAWTTSEIFGYSQDIQILNNYVKQVSMPDLEDVENPIISAESSLTSGFPAWDSSKASQIHDEMTLLSGN